MKESMLKLLIKNKPRKNLNFSRFFLGFAFNDYTFLHSGFYSMHSGRIEESYQRKTRNEAPFWRERVDHLRIKWGIVDSTLLANGKAWDVANIFLIL